MIPRIRGAIVRAQLRLRVTQQQTKQRPLSHVAHQSKAVRAPAESQLSRPGLCQSSKRAQRHSTNWRMCFLGPSNAMRMP